MAVGGFQRIIPESLDRPGAAIERVLLCSGKYYFELVEHREKSKRANVAIVRVEQLYPLPDELLQSALAAYRDGTPVFWAQEEPENMGAWRRMRGRFGYLMQGNWPFSGIYRTASASPATGSPSSHKAEQRQIVEQAFGPKPGRPA